jgi:hypothetical protein
VSATCSLPIFCSSCSFFLMALAVIHLYSPPNSYLTQASPLFC